MLHKQTATQIILFFFILFSFFLQYKKFSIKYLKFIHSFVTIFKNIKNTVLYSQKS